MERKKRSYDPATLRERVLDVTAAAFQEAGYNATAMHDIVRAAGTTGGALHHHFPTKKALGLAVIRHRVATAVEEAWIAPMEKAADTAGGVRDAFGAIIAELEEKGAVSGCPLNNLALELSCRDADFRAAVDAVFARWRQAIADKLRQDATVDEACRRDADATATFVIACYSGAMAMAKASQSTAPLETCAARLAAFLRGGARSGPAGRRR